jgi:hypothetical protein
MTRYKNLARIQQEEEELARLEEEYRKANGQNVENDEQPLAVEEPVETEEDKNWKKRYSDLRSYTDRQKNEQKARDEERDRQIAELKNEIARLSLPQNDIHDVEGARDWERKYPDLARTLKTLWREDLQIMREVSENDRNELKEVQRELARNRAYNAVLRAHPDFEELINNPDFQDWVDKQPEEKGVIGQTIFDALRVNETDADAAIKAVDIYKREQEFTRRPRKNPAREAIEVPGRTSPTAPAPNAGGRIFKESEVEAMSLREWEPLEKEIDLAKREGRFVYDVSGATR